LKNETSIDVYSAEALIVEGKHIIFEDPKEDLEYRKIYFVSAGVVTTSLMKVKLKNCIEPKQKNI
jgi:hypothetical protein